MLYEVITESVLSRVLVEMTPMKLCPGNGRWDNYLTEQLGGAKPEQIFLGPIISEGVITSYSIHYTKLYEFSIWRSVVGFFAIIRIFLKGS